MYVVTITNGGETKTIHGHTEKLASGKITQGINTIDSFQFTMLPSNAGFYDIHDYTTLVTAYNTVKNRYDFFGRVLYSEDSMSESGDIRKDVICESFLGFLCDSQQEYVEERNWRVGELLEYILNQHNSQMEGYKQFRLGELTVTDPNDNVYCGIQRKNTWETIKEHLLTPLGGELRFRVDGGEIVLDYLEQAGVSSSTEIALSRNMKSISREKDPSDIVTRLIPLGCKMKAIDEEGKEYETEYRLDISSINDGKNYVEDELAVSIYGIRVATVEFDDVTVKSTLMKKGEDWLKENNKIKVNYTASALDLSLIGLDVDDFEVCNFHPLKNPLLGINDTVRIVKKSIDVCEEVKSTIEFGDNFETLTEAMRRQSDALNLIRANYVTNVRFVNAIEKTSTLIEQTEERIMLEMTAEYTDLSATVSRLTLDVNGIETEVSKKVGNDELGTKISQNYEAVRIAWNQNSKYISFEDGRIRIYEDEDQADDSLLCDMSNEGVGYYNDGKFVGIIGTTHMGSISDDAPRGLYFGLAHEGEFLAWGDLSEDALQYDVKFAYYSSDAVRPAGLHFWCPTYAEDNLHLNENVILRGTQITLASGEVIDGGGLYSETAPVFMHGGGALFVCGDSHKFFTNASQTVYCHNNLDMRGFSIVETSDARLKTNIEPTSVNALDLISQIEMKKFDWVESGEHCEIGVIAQQLQEIEPSLVAEDKETGRLSIKVNRFIPYLIKAVQELSPKGRRSGKWRDTFTEDEKRAFVAANKPDVKLEIKEPEEIRIPIKKRGKKK